MNEVLYGGEVEMKEWKHATQQEVDAMTFDEAVEILQKQIDMGEKKVKDGEEWCAETYTAQACLLVLHRALHANGVRESLMAALKRNRELRDENTRLRYILWGIINECKKPHYDREDDLNSYYKICSIIKNANEYLEKKGDRI